MERKGRGEEGKGEGERGGERRGGRRRGVGNIIGQREKMRHNAVSTQFSVLEFLKM